MAVVVGKFTILVKLLLISSEAARSSIHLNFCY